MWWVPRVKYTTLQKISNLLSIYSDEYHLQILLCDAFIIDHFTEVNERI